MPGPRKSPKGQRFCRRCKTSKPVSEYYEGRRVCKLCKRTHSKRYRTNEPAQFLNEMLQQWGRA